ncbi:MAG: ketopantoate reductase family protein [Candidatus Hodarchaeales archaeon]
MRVAVIGVGAIGGPIAAHLVENDIDVTVVTKYPKLAQTIQSKGLRLQEGKESRFIRIKAVPLIPDLDGLFEIVFFVMKAFDVKAAARAVLPYLHDDGVAVTLQNGIVEDEVAAILGKNRVVGAVVFWASTMVEHGMIQRQSKGRFIIGILDEQGNQQRLNEVEALLGYCSPVVITENIYDTLYSKLTLNAWFNGLQAISGLSFKEMFASKRPRQLVMGIITEAVMIADHLGINFVKLGDLDLPKLAFSDLDTPKSLSNKHTYLKSLGESWNRFKSSSLQSLERGRKSEIEYFNGYIAMKGKELGIKTPINNRLAQIAKEIEAGTREIISENLLELQVR